MQRYIRRVRRASPPSSSEKPLEIPPDQIAERKAIQREGEMKDLAWAHLQGAHARYLRYMTEDERDGAWEESHYVLSLIEAFRRLDLPVQTIQVALMDSDEE